MPAPKGEGVRVSRKADPLMKSLRDLRISKGITQAEVAEAIGVTAGMVSMYENGRRQPLLVIVRAWVNFLGSRLGLISIVPLDREGKPDVP
jgi:transcriptional regulator with XRE-family HTH domain